MEAARVRTELSASGDSIETSRSATNVTKLPETGIEWGDSAAIGSRFLNEGNVDLSASRVGCEDLGRSRITNVRPAAGERGVADAGSE